MNSRERMLAAINHEAVDRIPTDMWATAEVWSKLRDHLGEDADIMSELHIDGMSGFFGPDYIGPSLELPDGGSSDYWGVRRTQIAHEGRAYSEQSF